MAALNGAIDHEVWKWVDMAMTLRLEAEHESSHTSLHESQLAVAKMEGKLQAAQTQIASLEKGNLVPCVHL